MAISAESPESLAHAVNRAAPQTNSVDIRSRDDDMVSPQKNSRCVTFVLDIVAYSFSSIWASGSMIA
jgi:hypothetical protein